MQIKVTSSFRIFETTYPNSSFWKMGINLLLFGKKKLQILKFHVNNSFYVEISPSLF